MPQFLRGAGYRKWERTTRDVVLHPLFMIARVLPVPTTTTAQDNQKGGFHWTLATVGPSTLPTFQISRGSNEPPVNETSVSSLPVEMLAISVSASEHARCNRGGKKGRLRWGRGATFDLISNVNLTSFGTLSGD
jgi:hypothetical protein